MNELDKLKKELRKIKGNILLACTQGYDTYFEEFMPNVWRLNFFVDMETVSPEDLLRIKEIVQKNYPDYTILVSAWRKNTLEYWTGTAGKKNLLINFVPVTKDMKENKIDLAARLVKSEVIVGENFMLKTMFARYNWADYNEIQRNSYNVAYYFLKPGIPEMFRIGMLKSYILEVVVGAAYCKGRLVSSRTEIERFLREKIKDEKAREIFSKFYENAYDSIDSATRDALSFIETIFTWKGLNFFDNLND